MLARHPFDKTGEKVSLKLIISIIPQFFPERYHYVFLCTTLFQKKLNEELAKLHVYKGDGRLRSEMISSLGKPSIVASSGVVQGHHHR